MSDSSSEVSNSSGAAGGAAASASSDKKPKRSLQNDTALHVLKGAIVNVLGPKSSVTSSVMFVNAHKAEITIVWEGDTLAPETITSIESEANKIISQSLPIHHYEMSRSAAEEKYRHNPVNHTFIYDKFPVPESVSEFTICEIPNVNVNCCRGPHCEHTGQLEALKILKTKARKNKNEYEFTFNVGTPARELLSKKVEEVKYSKKANTGAPATNSAATTAPATPATPSTPSTAAPTEQKDYKKDAKAKDSKGKSSNKSAAAAVPGASAGVFANWRAGQKSATTQFSEQIIDELLIPALNKLAAGAGAGAGGASTGAKGNPTNSSPATLTLTPEVLSQLRSSVLPQLEHTLTTFGNVNYTNGYQALKEVNKVPTEQIL